MAKTWQDNTALINGLWPTVSWSPEERGLWHDELAERNQDWLHQALKAVAKNYATPKPTLKWVVTELDNIKRSNEAVTHSYIQDARKEKDEEIERLSREVAKERIGMIKLLDELPPSLVLHAVGEVAKVVGLKINTEEEFTEWSSLALGCTVVALERMAANRENERDVQDG